MEPIEPDDARGERLDRAVADRLAKLRTMPVDVSALRRAVEAATANAEPRAQRARFRLLKPFLTPMRAAAASLLIGGLIAVLLVALSGRPVLASPDRMAELHQSLVSGDAHVRTVKSVAEANEFLATQNPGGPSVPGVPDEHVMACCIHAVGHKKVSCVSLVADGVPVSMAVADAADLKLPASETLTVDGVTYHVQSAQGVQMVMSARNGRWVCLMGKLPTERLVELAKSLRF
jgi:hypothetical protein